MTKLSVNVACYNLEKYVARCLNSLVNQTLSDIEINCIDNGSTDRTLEIIKEFQDKHPNVHIHRNLTNVNLSGSRKNGLLVSKSDYVMMIDGDDWLEPNACEVLFNAITEADVDLVECDCHIVDLEGNRLDREERYCRITDGSLQGSEIFEALLRNNVGQMTWNKIYRTELARNTYLYYFGEGFFHKEDVLFTSILYRLCGSYLGIGDKLYNYRTGTGGSHGIDYFGRLRNAEVSFAIANAYYNMGLLNHAEADLVKKKAMRWMNGACPSNVGSLLGLDERNAYVPAFIAAWGGRYLLCLLRSDDQYASEIGIFWLNGLLGCLEKLPEYDELSKQHLKKVEDALGGEPKLSAELKRLNAIVQKHVVEAEV